MLIRAYTDEDMKKAVTSGLRSHGFTVFRTKEEANSGKSDEEQLIFATSINAVLLTHNVHDFPRIHYEWITTDKHHAGIIIAKRVSIGEIIRQTTRLAAVLSSEAMIDRLEYLSNW
jgi:hypothetical protein